ncbi:unnamed protein product [Coffea canephora]|uniref:Uncharacterized protein n=1 Tax=Coffea canephora TaxID=49390 RepID=A0A068UZQ1_COFCA|nr:unnamed protein product [Coffea canephora]
MEDESGAFDKSLGVPRSELKVLVGEKRARPEVEERSEFEQKRVKTRDLESVFRSEERTTKDAVHLVVDNATREIDLNANFGAPNNVLADDAMAPNNEECNVSLLNSRGFGLDLNEGDIFNFTMNKEPIHPCGIYGHSKSIDDSDCGSSVGPLEEKDPMKVWKEMKQNGFLSSSHGGVPMPKPRGRKHKNDGIKRKMELAKKEQVDRFAKMAAPSGLLNELNPGIINHVRNKKQVHSIIEALLKSERNENSHSGSRQKDQTKRGTKDFSEVKDLKVINRAETKGHSLSHEDGSMNSLLERRQMSGYPASFNNSASLYSVLTGVDHESGMVDTRAMGSTSSFKHPNIENEDEILALKLSSAGAITSENNSSLSNEESANLTSVTSLSVQAASVASHWLELLHQDIKGRLAALRRSKKRVRAVIHTELPFLLSKEFLSVQENAPYNSKTADAGHSHNSAADAHRAKWNVLFDQMDRTLSEEEKQLESWLNQVTEMQLHCDTGLFKYSTAYSLQHSSTFENDCRLHKADNSERDLAVRAAAASIYSTCNFLLSMENLPCC